MQKQKHSLLLQSLNTIVTSDSVLPDETEKNKKLITLLRLIYLLTIAFLVIFSFFAFAIKTKELQPIKIIIGIVTFFVFLTDYILHWITYPVRSKRKNNWIDLLVFPLSGVGIILLLSTLSSLYVIKYLGAPNSKFFDYFESITLVRLLRLVLLLKIFTPFKIFVNVFKEQKVVLINTFAFIFILIVAFALIIWNNEVDWLETQIQNKLKEGNVTEGAVPDSLYKEEYDKIYAELSGGVVTNFWDALYYSTVTLTTIGYGDFAPHAGNSKLIVVIISLLGIAIFAIPSGVVAGAVLTQIQEIDKKNKKEKEME
ncbi:potassium channel family protein [Mycoplasma crocodyli]|uniref:Potassium channel protein n=1 Tax=Mycoplasma crocodyli (strain ATCC 51981 / MP145) TaxID=512564 RepID=D5E5A7_MYCCM|nr:potassium channel family protein [Mycoplasma crocodyli]ADE19831.1 potassium channel protein [Mycoplasma crocodyli MP145]